MRIGAPLVAVAAVGLAGIVNVVGALNGWRRRSPAAAGLSVERRLLVYLMPYWPAVLVALGIGAASVVVGLAKPWPTKILVDNVLGRHPFHGLGPQPTLALTVAATLLLFAGSAALGVLQTRVVYGLAQRLIEDMRGRLFGHLTRLSLRYHDTAGAGDGIYRVTTDTYAVQAVLLNGLLPTATALLTLIGTLLVMLKLDVELTLVAVVSTPLALVVTSRFGGRIRSFALVHAQRESEVYAQAEQTLGGIRTVQAFARQQYETDRFRGRVTASRQAMMRLVSLQTVFGISVNGVLAAGMGLVTLLAAEQALSGRLSTGEVLVFITYAGSLYSPVSGLSTVFADLQQAAANAYRVFHVLDQPQPEEPDRPVPTPTRSAGIVAFHNVSFSYRRGQPVLHGVSFDVRSGELAALVGPTGAGKSTIASLLLRMYDPTRGRITLDGIDVRHVRSEWLREQVAFVPQDPVLFPDSVRENIRYGRLDATDAEVEQAARDANIFDELVTQADDLDTAVGDRGVILSGGQRQRVALARAFLRDAPVVLLDEPTSALDAGTEALIMDAVERLTRYRTCVVIAHRLATVKRADQVLVVQGGRIVQSGAHARLIRVSGLYRDLHEARFGREPGPEARVGRSTTVTNGSKRRLNGSIRYATSSAAQPAGAAPLAGGRP